MSATEEALVSLALVPFGLVGGLLVAKRPGHPVGWYLAGIAVTLLTAFALDELAQEAVARDWAGDWIPWVAWTAGWLNAPFAPLIGLMIATFPNRRIVNRLLVRTAPVQYAAMAVIGLVLALRAGPTVAGIPNPLRTGVSQWLAAHELLPLAGGFALIYGLVAGVDLIIRYRRSRGIEQAQLKWFAASLGFFAAAMLWVFIPQVLWVVTGWALAGKIVTSPVWGVLGWLAFAVGLGGMAVAIAVAVLRYRLFEIDRIVRRTVTYAAVITLLAAAYGGLVVGFRAVLPSAGGSDVLVAGSTLVVAALFAPLLRWVRTGVERRFNRARYDASRTADQFALRLRSDVALEAVAADLRAVVGSTLAPTSLSLWLRTTSTDSG